MDLLAPDVPPRIEEMRDTKGLGGANPSPVSDITRCQDGSVCEMLSIYNSLPRNVRAGTKAEAMGGCCLLACSSWLVQPALLEYRGPPV